jgi:hypothetical protein
LLAIPGYELLEELGRGAMGVVYKARQVRANRFVALKMILAGPFAGEAERARFQIEAEAIARLQHPNIVQVYEVGEYEGNPFFSLEFCPGGSVDKKLNGTPLPPAEAASLVQTLARAVQAAHERGVIHRDLKPANILLGSDNTPKITDFGLAKKLDASGQTGSGAILGTPSYMAPEQAGGKNREVGPAADVYALGAILYECLTGRPPFKAATTPETLLQVLSDEPVPVRQLQPKTPRDLETICHKCLEKEVGKRYGSVAELAEELRRFSAGEPIAARPVGAVERGLKWARRRPALAAAWGLLMLALGLGVGGGGAIWLWQQAETARREAEDAKNDLAREKNVAEAALQGKLEAEQKARAAEKREAEFAAEFAQNVDAYFNYLQTLRQEVIALHGAKALSGFLAPQPLGGLATLAAVRDRVGRFKVADLLERHHGACVELGQWADAEADFRQLRAMLADTPGLWNRHVWAWLYQEMIWEGSKIRPRPADEAAPGASLYPMTRHWYGGYLRGWAQSSGWRALTRRAGAPGHALHDGDAIVPRTFSRGAGLRGHPARDGYMRARAGNLAEMPQFVSMSWSSLNPLRPHVTDMGPYYRVCGEMDERFPKPNDPDTANALARTRLLVGGAFDKGRSNRLVRLAKFAVDGRPDSAEYRATYGAALYRAGKFEAAVEQLNVAGEGQRAVDSIWQQTFLAMANHRLGKREQARDLLTRAVRQMERQSTGWSRGPTWDKRVEWHQLYAEAAATLVWDVAPPASPAR